MGLKPKRQTLSSVVFQQEDGGMLKVGGERPQHVGDRSAGED